MPNYILAYHPGKMPGSPEEGAKLRASWKTWVDGVGDAMVNPGTPLGKSWTVSAGGVSDDGGPNPLMGFSVVKADSIDAALRLAKACPHLAIGSIEVAEMKQM
ncbi:MAG: hypothetical protein EXR12_02270 [Rhodospirillaceae bacterium]|nr:hypothetical protein [Rhodospirillaceae bacterium]